MVCGFVFTSCEDPVDKPGDVAVADVTLTGAARFGLMIGEYEVLSYTIQPEDATNRRVIWLSSNPDVASVTNGIVEAKADGTAIITVRTVDGNHSKSCIVTVSSIPVEDLTLNRTVLELAVRDETILIATIEPSDASNKFLTWSSSRTSVATVTNGKVTGVAGGTAVITARTHNGKTKNCTVTVITVPVVGVDMEPELDLDIWASQRLIPTIEPVNATNLNVRWSSSAPAVATVSPNGTVTGIGKGTATITVTTVDGSKTAICAVSVTMTVPEILEELIKGGPFTMGSLEGEEGHFPYKDIDQETLDEYELDRYWTNETRHQVTLTKDFYMSTYPVTQALYKVITGNNPSYFNVEEFAPDLLEDWPVDSVTWYDAVEFCNKLSTAKGLTPVYDIRNRSPATGYPIIRATVECDWNANGYRLPTEAEWEYACRAGTDKAFNFEERIYNAAANEYRATTGTWGSDYIWIDWANFDGAFEYNSRPTSPYGEWWGQTCPWLFFEEHPNQWGLFTMHGNVEEWCWDLFNGDDYTDGPMVTDPRGPTAGSYRATRGGSFLDQGEYVRSSARNGLPPGGTTQNHPPNSAGTLWMSFRIVRNATGSNPGAKMVPPAAPSIDEQSANRELRVLPQNMPRVDRNSVPSTGLQFQALRRRLEVFE
jgi:uncharacterized protein YjdB/formylglycine-generating enzyme required for sulfatase activity